MSSNKEEKAKRQENKEKFKKTDIIAIVLILSAVSLSVYYVFNASYTDEDINRLNDLSNEMDKFLGLVDIATDTYWYELLRLDQEINASIEAGLMTETEANITMSALLYTLWVDQFMISINFYTYDFDSIEELSPGILDIMFGPDNPWYEFVFVTNESRDNAHFIYDGFPNSKIVDEFGTLWWNTFSYDHTMDLLIEQFYEIPYSYSWHPSRYYNYISANITSPLNRLNTQKQILLISVEANTIAIVIMGFAFELHKIVKYFSIGLAILFLLTSVLYVNVFPLLSIP